MSARVKRDLTQGDIFSHLWKMALPMFLGVMAHMLFNIVDGIFVSYLGTEATMAVLNYGFPLFYIPFALFNGLNAGVAAIIAQQIGRKDLATAKKTLSQMWWISLGIFFLIAISYPFIIGHYASFLAIPSEIAELTNSYISIILLALFFNAQTLILGAGLRAEGNMRTLMNAMMLGTLSNILLDPFFIFGKFSFLGLFNTQGLGLGVAGAAIATVIASALSFLYIATHYLRKQSSLAWPQKPSFDNALEIKKVFQVSVPSMVSQSLMGFNLMAVSYLAIPFGQNAIAALGIGLRLDVIAVFPSLAIMTAVVSLVGQNFGAQKFDRVKESIAKGLLCGLVLLSGLGVLAFFFREFMVNLFNPESATLASAAHYIACTSWSYGFIGLTMVSSGAFQGLGLGLPNLILTASRLFVLNFGLSWILSRYTTLGELGLHYAPMITNFVTGIVAIFWLRSYLKKKYSLKLF